MLNWWAPQYHFSVTSCFYSRDEVLILSTSNISETPCRIIDWLSSCSAANEENDSPLLSAPEAVLVSLPRTKRKRRAMADDTPRAKRPALGIATPSNNIEESARTPIFGNTTPSLKSSNASSRSSSRSSSPTKRKREAEITFSRPAPCFYTRSDSRDWKLKHTAQVPLLKELVEGLESKTYDLRIPSKFRHTFRKILSEIEKCQQRSSSEEQWSDSVVLRAMRTARKLSLKQEDVESVNVSVNSDIQRCPLTVVEKRSKSGLLISRPPTNKAARVTPKGWSIPLV